MRASSVDLQREAQTSSWVVTGRSVVPKVVTCPSGNLVHVGQCGLEVCLGPFRLEPAGQHAELAQAR